jgi:sugar O-acyltransferase (sialic acid O-acetyltransferase NeuD family)
LKKISQLSMKKIVILGSGGNCVDILETLLDINDARGEKLYECVGFLDDKLDKIGTSLWDVKVLGPLEKARDLPDCFFIFGIGSTANFWRRQEILSRTGIPDERFETLLHPTASVSRMSQIGTGTVVLQHVTINNNAKIGKHVYILPNTVISHDDVIGDFSCIAGSVSISGNVHIGHSCYVGAGSSIREGLMIGDNCLIGMGSIVLKDVPENSVMVGNPARFLRNTQRAES